MAKKVGRPKKVLSDEQIAQIEPLAAVLTKAQMADFFGITEKTLREVESRQPKVFTAYKKGKASAIATVANNLVNQARNGNVTAAIFYLKTQAGWKETDLTALVENADNVIQVVRATGSN